MKKLHVTTLSLLWLAAASCQASALVFPQPSTAVDATCLTSFNIYPTVTGTVTAATRCSNALGAGEASAGAGYGALHASAAGQATSLPAFSGWAQPYGNSGGSIAHASSRDTLRFEHPTQSTVTVRATALLDALRATDNVQFGFAGASAQLRSNGYFLGLSVHDTTTLSDIDILSDSATFTVPTGVDIPWDYYLTASASYTAELLGLGATRGGISNVDASHTAHVWLDLLDPLASFTSASGSRYLAPNAGAGGNVPEPSSLALLVLALACAALPAAMRRK